jgi:hypothetical protein
MVRDTLNVKFLEHCEPGELVRIDLGAQVQWGIVARRQQKRNVVVISGESAPWCLDPRDAVLLCLTYGESLADVPPASIKPLRAELGNFERPPVS